MKRLVLPALVVLSVQCGQDKASNQTREALNQDAASGVAIAIPQSTPTPFPVQPALIDTTVKEAFAINFQPKVGKEDLVCFDKSDELLQRGQIFTDLRFFVSNVIFIDDQGKEFKFDLDVAANSANLQFVDKELNSLALLNFLDPTCAKSEATKKLKSAITGSLPRGVYKAIRFQLGLPYPDMSSKLASVPAALAPSDMGWMWQHLPADIQIEVNTGKSNGSKTKIFNSLTSKTKTSITLPLSVIHNDGEAKSFGINLDLSKLFKTTALDFAKSVESACNNSDKSVDEDAEYCAYAYQALGLPVLNSAKTYEQSVFSVAL
jgi:hypothetical protein